MALKITHINKAGLNLYAVLFSAASDEDAFNASSGVFEPFFIVNQNSFVLSMEENPERVGYYSYIISDVSGIPASPEGQQYMAEVRRRIGSSPDRASDILVALAKFSWDGEKEISECKLLDESVSKIVTDVNSSTIGTNVEQILINTTPVPRPTIEPQRPAIIRD